MARSAARHLLGNDLVREARRRAGLTQRELAELAGTTHSAIARLEGGRTSPSFENVLSLVRLCGLDLDVMLVPARGAPWSYLSDISMVPTGTEGYPDLVRDADQIPLLGVTVSVSCLADIVRSKQAANRLRDQRVLPVLREILARRLHEGGASEA